MRFYYPIFVFLTIYSLFIGKNPYLFGQDNTVSYIDNYPLTLYDGNPQNWCVTEDHRGVMYFANQDGFVLEYDGTDWRKINLTELTSVRSLATDSLGTIYVGTVDDFGYLSPDPQGNLKYVSLVHLIDSTKRDFGEIWSISINKDEVFFQGWENLFRLKDNKIREWDLTELYHRSFVVNSKFYIRQKQLGITVLNKDSFELINGGEQFSEEIISAMIPFSKNKILIGTRSKGLYIYDPDNLKTPIYKFNNKADHILANSQLYHGVTIGNDKFAFATLEKGIIIINREGEITKEVNKSHSLLSDGTYFIHNQNDEILWIGHENGISKILINSPFQFMNESIGSAINNITSFDNKLYLATDQGVKYLPAKNDLLPENITEVTGITGMTWDFLNARLPVNKNGTDFTNKLLVGATTGLFEIVDNRALLIKETRSVFSLYTPKKDPNIIFAGFKDGLLLFKWDYKTKSWTSSLVISDINSEIRYISEDKNNDIWMFTIYDGVYRLRLAKIKTKNNKYVPDYSCSNPYKLDHFTVENGLPSNNGIMCSSLLGNIVFNTSTGLYKYNRSSNSFSPDTTIHPILAKPSTNIFRFVEDSHGNVWIDSDMIFYKQADNTYILDSLSLKKIKDERIDAIYPEENGIIWFGGDGLYRYDSNIKKNFKKIYPSLIRKVSLKKDSVIFWGANFDESNRVCIEQPEILKPIIDHKFNSLSFEYAAIFMEKEKNIQYSYILENFDNKWSQWSNEVKKEYTNLFEGNYIFKVRAKNIYDIESTIATYSFKVLPPFYRTTLAYIVYILLFAFIIYSAIRINAKRLKAINIRLEDLVEERTKEILLQKSEIELQANELSKLSIVASETDNAITIMDANGDIQWFNNAYAELFGYSFDELVEVKGKNMRNISSNEDIEEVIANCVQQKKSVIYETMGKRKTGENIWTQTTITPILDHDEEVVKLVSIDANIEKIKKIEEELIQKTEEISAQRDALAEANATKDKFFSIISHDLKSPFNAILGFSELLSQNFKSIPPEKGEIYSKQIFTSSKQAFSLVENLLQWSRAKTDKIKSIPEKLDLKEIVTNTANLLQLNIIEKDIKLETDIKDDLFVHTDINLLSMILRNLISNAIKFTDQKGLIKISAEIKDEFSLVSVCDKGVGISDENLKKLFREDIHYTTRGTNEEKGTGLGLILCKEFLEKSGGKIWATSKLGEGSTFYFTIPLFK